MTRSIVSGLLGLLSVIVVGSVPLACQRCSTGQCGERTKPSMSGRASRIGCGGKNGLLEYSAMAVTSGPYIGTPPATFPHHRHSLDSPHPEG